MIEISRALARQLRALLRKSIPAGAGRGQRPDVILHAGRDGLCVRIHQPDVVIAHHRPGAFSPDEIALPGEALDDFEGRKEDELITLESLSTKAVLARWTDGGVPQMREYATPDAEKLPPLPEEPGKLSEVDAGFLQALDDAAHTAAKDGTRFALQKLQLCGGKGEVVATDGRQLLIQGHFTLPWEGDVLIAALGLFGCRDWIQDGSVAIGKTDEHVCLRVGPWTLYFTIDKEGRFPQTESVIPHATENVTTCHLGSEDAAFLLKVLPRLPGREEDNAPLTVDLNGPVTIRAKEESSGRITEVILAHSTVAGSPLRFACNRQLLARALQLGFSEFRVIKPDAPIVSRDKFRTFLWMPLGKDDALPPCDDVLRISSAGDETVAHPLTKQRREENVTKPVGKGQSNGHAPRGGSEDGQTTNGAGLAALIAEAQSLKEVLHHAYGRTNRLLIALKRQRKQSRLMQTTLASLKQLQQIES